MNRFKKELIKRGFKLEHQYDWLPYEVSKNIYIEATVVDSEKATLTNFYNVIVNKVAFNRDMSCTNVNCD